jgi:hypothetical protein
MRSLVVNGLWWASCLPGAAAFGRARRSLEKTQRTLLAAILHRNRNTLFGRAHGFSSISGIEEYRRRVPTGDYEALRQEMDAMAGGAPDVLFRGRPTCFEPTSGSTGEGKLIPYSRALQKDLDAALSPWIGHLFLHHPALLRGRAYWSISPAAFERRRTAGGIPVGFENDTDYMNPYVRRLIPLVLAVPPEVAGIRDMDTFRYVTLAFLLKAKDLSLVSVWHPTFLTLLLDSLQDWGEPLARDVGMGALAPPTPLPSELEARLNKAFGKPDPKRADEIDGLLRTLQTRRDGLYRKLWPRLRVISCWADAAAKGPAGELKALFPAVEFQPKGLMATEGIVSVPVSKNNGATLAARSHFYEFLPESDVGEPLCGWQLERGARYEVVITTGGGLYRYRMGDTVRVTGFDRDCPVLEFTGRCGKVSDLYGEKLHEDHVASVIDRVLPIGESRPSFAMLAPEGPPDHYVLFLAGDEPPARNAMKEMEVKLEEGLAENVHYAYCRRLGQLQGVRIRWIQGSGHSAMGRYLHERQQGGVRSGDVKPVFLESRRGWNAILDPCEDPGFTGGNRT